MAGAIEHDEAAPADLLTTDERREIMALCSEAGRAPKFSERAKLQAELIGMVETIARREFERGAVAALSASVFDGDRAAGLDVMFGIARGGMRVTVEQATGQWVMRLAAGGAPVAMGEDARSLAVALGVLDEDADRG